MWRLVRDAVVVVAKVEMSAGVGTAPRSDDAQTFRPALTPNPCEVKEEK